MATTCRGHEKLPEAIIISVTMYRDRTALLVAAALLIYKASGMATTCRGREPPTQPMTSPPPNKKPAPQISLQCRFFRRCLGHDIS